VIFNSGDPFVLKSSWCNPGESVIYDYFIILDVYDSYWFWPEWQEDVSYRTTNFSDQTSATETILEFEWPETTGNLFGLAFWAAFVDPETFLPVGNVDHICFGYE